MAVFNTTLWDELDGSALFRMVPKTSYPLNVPQRPEDWLPEESRAGQQPRLERSGPPAARLGGPPVTATYMPIGYAADAGRPVRPVRLVLQRGAARSRECAGIRENL